MLEIQSNAGCKLVLNRTAEESCILAVRLDLLITGISALKDGFTSAWGRNLTEPKIFKAKPKQLKCSKTKTENDGFNWLFNSFARRKESQNLTSIPSTIREPGKLRVPGFLNKNRSNPVASSLFDPAYNPRCFLT